MSNLSMKSLAILSAAIVATMAGGAVAQNPLIVDSLDTPVVQDFNANLDTTTFDPAFLMGSLPGDAATLTTTAGTATALSGLGVDGPFNSGPLNRIATTGYINGSNVDFIRLDGQLENNPIGRAADVFQVTVENDTFSSVTQATVSFDFSIINRGGMPGTSFHNELLGFEGYYSVNGSTWTNIPGLGGEAAGNHSATFAVNLGDFDLLWLRFVDDNGSDFSSYDGNMTRDGEGAYGFDNFSITLSQGSVGGDGDFDHDGDTDGNDFLIWQRGGSAGGIGSGDLGDWQANYGAPLVASVSAVPEPGSLLLLSAAFLSVAGMRRSRSS